MSNTHHSKRVKDLWSKRPCSGLSSTPYNKHRCRKIERKMGQSEISMMLKYLDDVSISNNNTTPATH